MAWKTVKYQLTGVAPLILHNGELADQLNPYSKAIRQITSKTKKTDADLEEMAKREWYGCFYMDEDQIIIPDDMLTAVALSGAKKDKRGTEFRAGVFAKEHSALTSKSRDDLWGDPDYRFSKVAKQGQNRIVRTRPIFKKWEITTVYSFEDGQVNERELTTALEKAGNICGLGDWRPRYGRFTVKKV